MLTAAHREAIEAALFDLFDSAALLQESAAAQALPPYHQGLLSLGEVAKLHRVNGLSYVCMLLDEGLRKLAAQQRELSAVELNTLVDWPAAVMNELLGSPPARAPQAWAVLEGPRQQAWFPEVPAHFLDVIVTRLWQDVQALSQIVQAQVDGAAAAPDCVAWPEPLAGPPAVQLAQAAMPDEARSEALIDALNDTLGEVLTAAGAELPGDELGDVLGDALGDALSDAQGDVQGDVQGDALGDAQDDAQGGAQGGALAAADLQTDDTPAPAAVAADELGAVSDAVQALHDDFAPLLNGPPLTAAAREEAFADYIEHLQNLVNAAAMVGLAGFQQVIEAILINVMAGMQSGQALTRAQRGVALRWPLLACAYLAAPNESGRAEAFAAVAIDPAWPHPVQAAELPAWVRAMGALQVVTARAGSELAIVALAQDLDLSIPADIDRDVLDSLLLELPQHAQTFSALMQRLLHNGQLSDLEHAARVAHTLKGASNTVGVKGVAMLTHALEDILVACVRDAQLPSPALADTLLEAADCLESMSEALLAGQAAPQGGVAVLQKVLDWVHHGGREGVPPGHEVEAEASPAPQVARTHAVAHPLPPTAPTASAAPAAGGAEPGADESETYLRVPASLVEMLLRQVAESAIVAAQIQDRVARLAADLGGLRSGAQQFGKLSNELEQLVDVRGGAQQGGRVGELDALEMDQYNELHTLSRRIAEFGADNREFSRGFGREVTALRDVLAESERLQLQLQRSIMRTRMVQVESVAPRLQRTVRQAARVLGRDVQLHIEGGHTLVDSQWLAAVLDPLMHMLRNAVDHGIEAPEQRLAAGKPAQGRIHLRVASEGTQVSLTCSDDGRGLDRAAILCKARKLGLIGADATLSDEQTLRLILLPDFSTREHTTQISGRGIGMDVVQRAVNALRGSLTLQSQPGAGTRFDMQFAVQMSATQVLITHSPKHLLALSVRGVEQIRPAADMALGDDGAGPSCDVQGERVPVVSLEALLNLPPNALRGAGAVDALLVLRDEQQRRLAILVPELGDARNVVIKPFNTLLPRQLGVEGATILGDGSIATVLDLPDLLRSQRLAPGAASPGAAPAPAAPARLPLCLVVDDSISVRRTMEQLMQDAGYDVASARDGVDALSVLQRRVPDIVLVDLEMPRMNGLELTRALRNQAATRSTPVVMITSRFTERHHALAKQAGVDAFLTKPYSEAQLLNTMAELLHRAAQPAEPALCD